MQDWGVRAFSAARPWRDPCIPPMGWVRNNNLLEVTNSLGLTTNRRIILDAGALASYGGSGQPWLDLSGGFDFNRGTGSGSDAADPTFNGTAGALRSTEYWSFDGGDHFRYDAANESWMDDFHQDSALVSMVFWAQIATSAALQNLMGTYNNNSTGTGFRFRVLATDNLNILVANAGAAVLSVSMTATLTLGAWTYCAFTLDEAATTGTLQVNGTQESFTSTYSSPAAGGASDTMEIGARGGSGSPLESGARLAMVGVWSGTALTAANLSSIYTATRGRFGV